MYDQYLQIRDRVRAAYHYLFPSRTFQRYIANPHGNEVEMDYLDALVDPKREAIDVGANLGRYSIRLAALVRRVWAFEPHPRLAYILRHCLPRNVAVQQAAVSNKHQDVELHVPCKNHQQIESLATVEEVSESNEFRTIRVPCLCLDDFAHQDIGFVKIDVEGHEADVIRGGLRLLQMQQPIVLVEADDHHRQGVVAEVVQLMNSADYGGIFWFRDRFFDVAEFDNSQMQDERALRPGVPRKQCLYVNNFIFAPRPRLQPLRRQLMQGALRPQLSA
jgi:FkbM family methyltransferase